MRRKGRTERAHGKHYDQSEIDLIYRAAPSPDNDVALAKILDRTPEAINWVQRYVEEKDGPGPRASKLLRAQIVLARHRLGARARGKICLSLVTREREVNHG